MPFLQRNPDGSLLLEGGSLVSSEECCCNECPPLEDMPTVCQAKLTLETQGNSPTQDREGLKLISTAPWLWWARPAEGTPPVWTTSVVDGVTWYNYSINLFQDCCSYRCEDDIIIPLPDVPFECVKTPIVIECSDTIEDDFTLTYELTGNVRFAIREMISDTVLQLAFRMNCSTGVLERKITKLSFLGSEVIAGRFCVEETYTWERLTFESEDVDCGEPLIVTVDWNGGSDVNTAVTYYCDDDGDEETPPLPDLGEACEAMPSMPDWDTNSVTALLYYCWDHFTWEEVDKSEFRGFYVEHLGDWEVVTAMDDPITVDMTFEEETEYEFHTCPQGDFEIRFENNMATMAFDPPADWTPLSCNNTLTPPVEEAAVAIPGLVITNFTAGIWFGAVKIELEITTGTCPDVSLTECQQWDETDEWDGT